MFTDIEPIDHFPIIDLIYNKGIEFISALQEIQITYEFNKSSNTDIDFYYNYDWGTGFLLKKGLNYGFLSQNKFEDTGSNLLNLSKLLLKHPRSIFQSTIINRDIIKTRIDLSNKLQMSDKIEDDGKEVITEIYNFFNSINNDTNTQLDINLRLNFMTKNFQSSEYREIQQIYTVFILKFEIYDRIDPSLTLIDSIGGITNDTYNIEFLEKRIHELYNQFQELKIAKKPKSEKYNLILSEDATYTLIHETIGHAVEGDEIVNQNSYLTNKIGYKIANQNLSIVDDPLLQNLGWMEFDDEGTKTKGTLIVEDGILVDFLHTKRTAEMLNTETTGNARTYSYRSSPIPRQSNLYIEPRDLTTEELCEKSKSGLYIDKIYSGSSSIFNGEFTLNVALGHEIENGEIHKPVKNFQYIGNSLTALGELTGIGNYTKSFSTVCYKNNSRIYVGTIAPEISIANQLIL